jgi:inhibitor of KinA sporulation pathway (predicted exonuclease)
MLLHNGAITAWINVQKAFENSYDRKAKGMTAMLDHLSLGLEGRHHSGIDDCKNIARICARMLEDGWVPTVTGATLSDTDSNGNH